MSKANNTLRIDEILLDQGIASEEEIREALEYQREHGGRIGSHLIRLGFVTEEQLLKLKELQAKRKEQMQRRSSLREKGDVPKKRGSKTGGKKPKKSKTKKTD